MEKIEKMGKMGIPQGQAKKRPPQQPTGEAVNFDGIFSNEEIEKITVVALLSFKKMIHQKGVAVFFEEDDALQEGALKIVENLKKIKTNGDAFTYARRGISAFFSRTAQHPMGLTGSSAGCAKMRAANENENSVRPEVYTPHNNADGHIYISEFFGYLLKKGAPIQIKVLRLKMEGYRNAEISELLNISEKAVEKAAAKLRKSFGEFEE